MENKGKSDNERKEEIVKSMLLWLKPGGRELGLLMEEVTEGAWQCRLGFGASMTQNVKKRSFLECKTEILYLKAENYIHSFPAKAPFPTDLKRINEEMINRALVQKNTIMKQEKPPMYSEFVSHHL